MMKRTSALWLGVLGACGLLTACNLDKEEPPPPAPAPRAPAPPPAPMVTDGLRWDSMAFPTGDRATSTILLERGMPVEVVAGQEFCYRFKVTNLTSMNLSGVVLRDERSPNFTMGRTNPAAEMNGAVMTWNLGSMGPRESRMVEVCGKATGAGRIASCAVVEWNSLLCAEVNVVQPALKATIALPAERSLCEEICAQITVTNTGSGTASAVVINYTLPAGWTTRDGKNAVQQGVGDLGPNQSKVIEVCAKSTRTGTFSAQAMAQAGGGLSASTNTAQTIVRQPQLELALVCPQGQTFIGRTLSYEATVTNKGDGPATNAMLMIGTSGGMMVNASEAGGPNFNLGTLAPGASKKVSFTINPGGNFTGQVAVNAKASAYCANEPVQNCTSTVIGIPAQLLDGVDDPDPVQIGGTTTYTLRVSNQGSQPLTNVRLVGKLVDPDKMQYVSTSGPTGAGQTNGADVTFPPVPALAPRQSLTYTVVVKATGEGQVSFEARTSSDQVQRELIKKETTTFFR